jgi:hypothetical protein
MAKQLTMNEQTWATLQHHGVTEATALRRDFAYSAPGEVSAIKLQAVLAGETHAASLRPTRAHAQWNERRALRGEARHRTLRR